MGARVTDLSSLGRGGGAGRPTGDTQTRPLTARGVVARAPASLTDSMVVTVTTVTEKYGVHVPARNWDARSDGTLPAVGSHCLIVHDHQGDAWVPIWG